MPLNHNEYAEARKENPLDISTSDYYFNTLRPYLENMKVVCRTDPELIRTIDKAMNVADSFCVQKDYESVSEAFTVLNKAISDKSYFNGAMKRGTEEEKSLVRKLIEKINDLRMIIQCEPPIEKETVPIKERINYSSPTGENMDFNIHNMKTLNNPKPKLRIPNN